MVRKESTGKQGVLVPLIGAQHNICQQLCPTPYPYWCCPEHCLCPGHRTQVSACFFLLLGFKLYSDPALQALVPSGVHGDHMSFQTQILPMSSLMLPTLQLTLLIGGGTWHSIMQELR